MVKLSNKNRNIARQISSNAIIHNVTMINSTTVIPSGALYVRCTQIGISIQDIYINFTGTAIINGAGTTVLSRIHKDGLLFHVPSNAVTLAAIGTGVTSMHLEYFS